MVKRKYNLDDKEPEQSKFEKPSEREHLFQVVDVYDMGNAPGKMVLDENTVCAKLEVIGGDESGRTMLNRINLDESWKGFYFTRLFLKSIGEPYKGKELEIDSDRWIGRQFYANVVHNEGFANIGEYNFDKKIDQYIPPVGANANPGGTTEPKEIVWDE